MKTAPSRANTTGTPGVSSRVLTGTGRAVILRASWGVRAAVVGLLAGVGGFLAVASGYPFTVGVGLAVGLVLAGVGLLFAFDKLLLLLVLGVYAPATFPLGELYTAAASGRGPGDAVSGSIALFVAALVSLFVSVRYSRGRAWVTFAFTCFAAVLVAPFALLLAPSTGLNAARLAMAAVLLWRCGGGAWIAGALSLGWDKVRYRDTEKPLRVATEDDLDVPNTWQARAEAERDTAEVLHGLPEGFYVFHDVRVKGSGSPLGHLVLGPQGGMLMASVKATGPLKETPETGLVVPGVPLDRVVGTLIEQRRAVATALRSSVRDFAIMVVVHGVDAGERRTLAVFDPTNLITPTGQVVVVSPENLLAEVDSGFGMWSTVKVKQAAKRARMRLSPAAFPTAVPQDDITIPRLATLDADGKPVTDPALTSPSWVVPGAPVHIMTSLGLLTDLRVTGEPFLREGQLMVMVCVEEEWQKSQQDSRLPRAHPYPVNALRAL